MPQRLFAPAATAALLFLTTTAATAQAPETMNADQGWSSIKRCAQEDTERARHTCLDRVLRDAGLLTDEMHARQQRKAFGLDEKAARAPAQGSTTAPLPPASAVSSTAAGAEALNRRAAGTTPGGAATPPAAPATPPSTATTSPAATSSAAPARSAPPPPAAVPAPATAPAQPDRLDVELAKVEKAANGRLFVTTTDGAVWLQIETVEMPLPPVAGDRMSIRKGSLGGYRCTVASTHLTYRCARNR